MIAQLFSRLSIRKGRLPFFGRTWIERPAPATITGWAFDSGALTSIQIDFERATYAQAEGDVIQKLGKPTSEKPEPFQNGYGATWNDQIADWLTSDLHARLVQKNDPTEPRLWFTVESRAAYDAKIQQQASRPNSLD